MLLLFIFNFFKENDSLVTDHAGFKLRKIILPLSQSARIKGVLAVFLSVSECWD